MAFLTACYWQAENRNSLLLRRFVVKGIPVVFACIWREEKEEEKEIARILESWFQEFPFGKGKRRRERLLRAQGEKLKNMLDKSENRGIGGLFYLKNQGFLFGSGGIQLRLINQAMGKTCLGENLFSEEGFTLFFGEVQSETSFLLLGESLSEVGGEGLKNVLAPWETGEERQVKRRMKELGALWEKRGQEDVTAVLCCYR